MTTQAEKEMFEVIRYKQPTKKVCKKCGSRGYLGDNYIKNDLYECCMCHCLRFDIVPTDFPPITAEIREKIEEIILRQKRRYLKTCFMDNGCFFYLYNSMDDVTDNYTSSAETRTDALCNLVKQLPEIWDEVREVFNAN